MKNTITTIACLLALALGSLALAQIYESKDAEGNTVFSDTPTTAGDKAIDLPQTNVADPVKEMPEAAQEAAGKAAEATGASGEGAAQEGDVVIIGDARNERLEEDIARHRRNEVLDGQERHEVGDGEVIGEREVPERVEGAHPVARPHVGVPGR